MSLPSCLQVLSRSEHASETYGSRLTADQLGRSPHTVIVAVLINLEPFGLGGVKTRAITVAGSHIVEDGAEMI